MKIKEKIKELWNEIINPSPLVLGDKRVVSFFPILPMRLQGKWKWLKRTKVEIEVQKVTRCMEMYSYETLAEIYTRWVD